MLGQPISMLLPQVVGFKLVGRLREGATATDAVLTVTQMLREKGVVGSVTPYARTHARLAPSLVTSAEDVDRTLSAVRDLV